MFRLARPRISLPPFSPLVAFLFLFLTLSSAALAQGEPRRDAQQAINALVKDFQTRFPKAKVGVSSMVLKTGKVVYSHDGTKPMIPASNLKTVSTAVALDRLGSDFRFETKLYGPAKAQSGTAVGDLVLKAGGDPTFFPPYTATALEPLQEFARALKQNGISKVQGDLIIDDSDYDREYLPKSHLERYRLDAYAAPFGGLSLNRNVVTLNVSLNGVTTEPSTGSLQLVNKVSAGGYDEVWVERPRGSDRIVINGVVRPGSTVSTTLTIHDPVRFTGSALFRVLGKAGISLSGKWVTVPLGKPASLSGKVLLARHRSPLLKDLIRRTNVESDNLLAESLFRRLGASVVGMGSARNSEAVVRDFFVKNGIDDTGLKMVDGSGLSEANRISPFQLVRLFRVMWAHPNGQTFIDSLPAPSEGTLEGRLGGSLVRAKTGTLNNHTGLSGYVVTAYGQTVGFSVLVNDMEQVWPAVDLQDKIVSVLANQAQAL